MRKGKLKVVVCPYRRSDPATGHLGPQKPPLGMVPPPSAWDACLNAPGQWQGPLPSSALTRHRAVKHSPGAPLAQPPKGKEG